MPNGGLVCIPVADDLASRTDSGGISVQGAGKIQMSEGAVLVHEPVNGENAVDPCPNHHSRIVDRVELGTQGTRKWNINGGEDIMFQQKTVLVSIVVEIIRLRHHQVVNSASKAELRAEYT